MKYENAIVGAGITGMVLKKIFPNSAIISQKKGKIPPLFLLWKTKYTSLFVNKYLQNYEENRIFFDYLIDEKSTKKEMIEKYNLLTYKNKNSMPSKTRKKYINYYIINKKEINYKINYKKNIENLTELNKYKKIFWTAPIKRIFNKKQIIKPIYLISFVSRKELFSEKYIYLLINKLLNAGFYRITKGFFRDRFTYTVESTKWMSYNKIKIIKKFLKNKFGLNTKKYYINEIKNGHIINAKPQKDFSNIYFFGRYAQNNPKIMLSDVIEKCYKLKKRF